MADRLTGIEVFVKAIRLGSLSAAARAMGMSSSMAVRHLETLEARLATTLVRRTTRRLSLTEAGTVFLDRAERLLSELGEAEAEASAGAAAAAGLLRVAAPTVFATMHLAPLLPEFATRYPAIRIELGLNDRMVDLMEDRWDMAIRIGHLEDSSLVARRLAGLRLVLCAAPAYLARKGVPARVSDLSGHDCLGYTLSSRTSPTSWCFGSDGAMAISVHGSLAADNGHVLMTSALGGQGIYYGPRFIVAQALCDGLLEELHLDAPLADMGALYAVTHPTRRPAAKMRAWIDFLSQEIGVRSTAW